MTPSPVGSPNQPSATTPPDESQFPKGQCRYILVVPGIKGQRCGCVGFDHNRNVPGASCACGHLSCFHMTAMEEASSGRSQSELGQLKQRVQLLEDHVNYEENGELGSIASRMNILEDALEKNKEEMHASIQDSYGSIAGAWQLVEQMQKRLAAVEESYNAQNARLERTTRELQDLRNRQLELVDSDESLEERIEKLETAELADAAAEYPGHAAGQFSSSTPRRMSARRGGLATPSLRPAEVPDVPPMMLSGDIAETASWTVHVSLLPSTAQPFPFEKDTNAYKRCLSRGLHRMVAVESQSAEAFIEAVSRSFHNILKDRPWEPLQAKLCDAEQLQGLPMLRSLDPSLLQGKYDVRFLREHCAVSDVNGRIESLYVALRHDNLSWDFLRQCPVFLEGLESSWGFDRFLDWRDGADAVDDNGVLTTMPPGEAAAFRSGAKRGASEMTQGNDADERDGSRTKTPRPYPMSSMVELRRGVKTAL